MLNLSIAMLKIPLIFSLLIIAQAGNIAITSPLNGDILRGQVEIMGNMDIPGFSSSELAFSYASNPADSWFTIQTFPQPVANSTIATWDTTSLTDGDYVLHLRVFLQDGTSQDVAVSDLKIRNDLILPTATPTNNEIFPGLIATPRIEAPLPVVTDEPVTVAISFPSATPLPANPVSVANSSIYSNFGYGALITLFLFIVFSSIVRFRKN